MVVPDSETKLAIYQPALFTQFYCSAQGVNDDVAYFLAQAVNIWMSSMSCETGLSTLNT